MRRNIDRFPRMTLIGRSQQLDQLISEACGITAVKMREANDKGPSAIAAKLTRRYEDLNNARELAGQLRQVLWNLD